MTETSLFVWRDADGVRHFGDQEGWQAEQQRWEQVAMYYGKASIVQLAKAIAQCADGPIRITVERYKRDDPEKAKV
jgi:hypothetical protein